MGHVVVLTPHKLAVAHKEDLHDAVRVRIFLFDRDTQDIPVFPQTLGHLLLLGDLLDVLQQVPPADGLLELHLLRGLFHLRSRMTGL